MPLIPLACPSCGASLTVDSSKDAAICEFCGKPYIVKDAIVNNYINMTVSQATIHADSINLTTQNDFDITAGKLLKYKGENQEVIIPDSVSEIGERAFEKLNIRTVSIPAGVTKIGQAAFHGCEQLETINIPESVTKIESYTFCGCKQLKEIDIPNSITKKFGENK